MFIMQKIRIGLWFVRAATKLLIMEIKRGLYCKNLISLIRKQTIVADMSWADLLEEGARKYSDRVFILFQGRSYTYREMDLNANRMANFLLELGGGRGRGVALFMRNSTRFLDIFFGTQKIGMYSVPVNTSLRGDSLSFILDHCDAEMVIVDEELLDVFDRIADRLGKIKKIVVNPSGGGTGKKFEGRISLDDAYTKSSTRPDIRYDKDDICLILYTSGTTGLPKGVVYRYRRTNVKMLTLGSYLVLRKSDILYTPLSLCHGNALFLTVTQAMGVGARVVLEQKFSASRFWDDIRKHNVTVFNTIGAMIPIVMKQPERPEDNQNRARFTLSAACPVGDWEKFEKRFGIKIYEAYGAVDGGGKSIMNLGTAPVGSIGKPSPGTRYRLVDPDLNDVPDGTPGHLIFESSGGGKSVEYYKNEKASNEKLKDGWIHTGDLVKRDKKGFLYFVGRNAEFMRIKGENVSAYEVEHAIQKHPSVQEAAVYAVPSDLAEDEIMASVSLVEGQAVKEKALVEFLRENLPKFAIPRYVKIVKEFPKTETQRIIKKEVEKLGVAPGTYDAARDTYL